MPVHYPNEAEIKAICERIPYMAADPTVAFNLTSQQEAEQRFKTPRALLYSRFGNPVSHKVEDTISRIDGAGSALTVGSGTTANFLLLLTLAGSAGHLASSRHIFGGTYGGQQGILANAGIKTAYFDPRDPASLQKILKERRKIGAVFLETISNADNIVGDIDGIVDVAHRYNKPVIFDNTYAFGQFQPFKWGADFTTVSLTKGGGGGNNDVLGGVIESRGDSRENSWLNKGVKLYPFIKKFQDANPLHPDPAMGLLYGYAGSGMGTPLLAEPARTILNGLRSLPDRTTNYNKNAAKLAAYLDDAKFKQSGLIRHVNHLSLEHHPDHRKAERYMPGYHGSVMLVDFGTKARAAAFIDNSGYVGVHIMQNALMVTHPETTTHRQYTDAMREMIGIAPGTVRITVGNQSPDRIMEQVDRGLHAARMA